MKRRTVWATWLAAFGAGLLFVGSAFAQRGTGQAIITSYEHRGCVNRGQTVVILGTSFGGAQGLNRAVLWGYGQSVDLTVLAWTDARIAVMLPKDSRIREGRPYQIVLQDRAGNFTSNIGPSLSICAVPGRAAMPAADVDARARALADAVFRASGGGRWPKVKRIRFTFNIEQEGKPSFSVRHDWDVRRGKDTVSWSGVTVKIDLAEANSSGSAKIAYERWVNDSYWLLAPLKLKDPGVNLSYEGQARGYSVPYEILHVSFTGVGLTPTDEYRFYIDP